MLWIVLALWLAALIGALVLALRFCAAVGKVDRLKREGDDWGIGA